MEKKNKSNDHTLIISVHPFLLINVQDRKESSYSHCQDVAFSTQEL